MDFELAKSPGKKGIFRELRVKFGIFCKIIILEYFFVSNNFVSVGIEKYFWHFFRRRRNDKYLSDNTSRILTAP